MNTRADDLYNMRCELGYAQCVVCNTWYPQLDMNYDDDTGFHTCVECDDDEEEVEKDICCKCGRWWDKGDVCDCGCSHRACCDTCICEEEEEDDDWEHLCPNLHWGGMYGCDLCGGMEMKKEWLNKCNKYCYKLHKKWLEEKSDEA